MKREKEGKRDKEEEAELLTGLWRGEGEEEEGREGGGERGAVGGVQGAICHYFIRLPSELRRSFPKWLVSSCRRQGSQDPRPATLERN